MFVSHVSIFLPKYEQVSGKHREGRTKAWSFKYEPALPENSVLAFSQHPAYQSYLISYLISLVKLKNPQNRLLFLTMSEAFLKQILSTDNTVQPDDGQPCYICLEACGTVSPESGIVEIKVRLPCNHTMGSARIAQWLHANNTCPICREVFFPPEHRPSIEPATLGHREFGEADPDDEDGWDNMTIALYVYSDYCAALRLRNSVVNLVQRIIRVGDDDFDLLCLCGPEETAAACIYMASHLLRQPKSFREIARVAELRESDIRHAYKEVYAVRQELLQHN